MTSNQIIKQVENTRKANNKNWMDMLRLAFKHAPVEARKIMGRISKCDEKVNKLLKQLNES